MCSQVPYDVVIPEPVQVQVPVEQIVTQTVCLRACVVLFGFVHLFFVVVLRLCACAAPLSLSSLVHTFPRRSPCRWR